MLDDSTNVDQHSSLLSWAFGRGIEERSEPTLLRVGIVDSTATKELNLEETMMEVCFPSIVDDGEGFGNDGLSEQGDLSHW